MNFEQHFNSIETTIEEGANIGAISPEIVRLIERNNLEEEISVKEKLNEEIFVATAEEPETIKKDKAPGDMDLYFLKPEEALERKKLIRERYSNVLENIKPLRYDNRPFIGQDSVYKIGDKALNSKKKQVIDREGFYYSDFYFMSSFFILIGFAFGVIAGLMAFLITWHEYQRHNFKGKRLFMESFRPAIFAFIFFLVLSPLIGFILTNWVVNK